MQKNTFGRITLSVIKLYKKCPKLQTLHYEWANQQVYFDNEQVVNEETK